MSELEPSLDHNILRRPLRQDDGQGALFETGERWEDYWWGMPSFEGGDARPQHTITVNMMTREDLKDFADKLGIKLSTRADSMWWPPQEKFERHIFDGPKVDTRYPVYIMSKGRADCMTTAKVLDRMGVRCTIFVEETEADAYQKSGNHVVSMPFHDLGQGSIPARNYIWEYAKEREHARHWVMDDNISSFGRCTHNRKIRVHGSGLFHAIEDWCDRYENVAFAGPHCDGFVMDRLPSVQPILFNSRIYSCTLIKTDLPYRWRGRYNEDTDLCLRALKDGWVTALFRALLMKKGDTYGSKIGGMKGGNTDNVYNTDDHRRAFADSLKEQHPECVEIVWKFGRWHHQVDYSAFAKNKLILRDGVTPTRDVNEYGMKLVRVKKD